METKSFSLGDVLSITTGRLVSERHIDGVYDILNFMTGDNLFTHQLPRAMEECRPFLLKQFPELAEAGTPANLARLDELIEGAECRNEPPENGVAMWLQWMAEPGTCNLKASYEVQQIPRDAHQLKDPLEELVTMVGPSKVVVVAVSGNEGGGN